MEWRRWWSNPPSRPPPNVGWVLPLPAEPTKLAVGDSGMLTSLSMSIRPRITNDLSGWRTTAAWVVALALIVAWAAIGSRDGKKMARGSAAALVVYVLVFLFASLPHLGRSLTGAGTDVSVTASHRLGSYDVTVLQAKNAEALSEWLRGQALMPLTPAAETAVADYIGRNWCFLVARLRHEAGTTATPHPLVATFSATAPVFPMKLTAVAAGPTRVELLVVSDKRANALGFHCVASDKYRSRPHPWASDSRGLIGMPAFEAVNTDLVIGSPDAGELIWDGCIVTKLAADLTPMQMAARDVELQWLDPLPHRDHFYSQRARRDIIITILLWGAVAAILATGVACAQWRRPSRKAVAGIGCICGITLIASLSVYALLPVVPVVAGRRLHPMFVSIDIRNRLYTAYKLADEGKLNDTTTIAALSQLPELAKGSRSLGEDNPCTGRPRTYERIPGEYTIRKTADKTFFCLYDEDGREVRLELPPPKQPTATSSTGPASRP